MINKKTPQNFMVSIYWTPAYVKDLDKLAAKLGLRRNELIKQAVNEKIDREKKKLN